MSTLIYEDFAGSGSVNGRVVSGHTWTIPSTVGAPLWMGSGKAGAQVAGTNAGAQIPIEVSGLSSIQIEIQMGGTPTNFLTVEFGAASVGDNRPGNLYLEVTPTQVTLLWYTHGALQTYSTTVGASDVIWLNISLDSEAPIAVTVLVNFVPRLFCGTGPYELPVDPCIATIYTKDIGVLETFRVNYEGAPPPPDTPAFWTDLRGTREVI